MRIPRIQNLLLLSAAAVIASLAEAGRRAVWPVASGLSTLPRTKEPSLARGAAMPGGSSSRDPVRKRSAGNEMTREIRRLFAEGNEDQRQRALTTLLPEWVRMNPSAASAFCMSLQPGTDRDQSLRVVMATWSQLDACSALEWAAGFLDPGEREFATGEGYREIGRHDRRRALEMLWGDDPGGGQAVANDLIQSWADSDPRAALEWLEGHPSSAPETDERWSALAVVLARDAPAEAAALVVERIPPGAVQSEAVVAVLHQWALRDPAGAAAWVDLFSEGELRTRAENELAGISAYRAALGASAP